jgi:hypothetical protein
MELVAVDTSDWEQVLIGAATADHPPSPVAYH